MTLPLILTTTCLLGAFQGLVLALALASLRDGLIRANRVLASSFVVAAVVMMVIVWSHHPSADMPRSLELFEFSMWLFAGPVFYLYVRLVFEHDQWPRLRFLAHFVPGILVSTYFAIWLIAVSTRFRLSDSPWLPPVAAMMLLQMAYTGLGIRRWLRSTSEAPKVGGRKASLAPGPHNFLLPAVLFVLVIQHCAQLVRWLFTEQSWLRDIVPLTAAASFLILGFLGLRRAIPLLGAKTERYSSSTLSTERSSQIAEKLDVLWAQKHPYLRADITLDDIAAELGVAKTHLSQVINERFGEGFLELVARHRVRESERLLVDPASDHLTIEALARRSGFRSRSAFYDAFRRLNGMTPSEFRKQSG